MKNSNKSYRTTSAAVLAGLLSCVLVIGLRAAQVSNDAVGVPGDDTVFHDGFGLAPDVIRASRGLSIAPVPLDLDGRDVVLVGLGSYLVNTISGCSECHTNPPYADGGNPFMGQPMQINTEHYLAGGKPFGPFTSRNITPDLITGLPAGRTYDEFSVIMRNGLDFVECDPSNPPTCAPLLQVMPWPVYHHLAENDLRAIYEYLSAIPHAEPLP